ncbi:MAG: lipoyl domain-containing protein [Planctomycetaceae bacterium]
MAAEVVIPRLGWSMEEGTFGEWLKPDGAVVKVGDPLFVLEGEKSAQDIEAVDAGVLRIPTGAPRAGDTVLVGQVVAFLCDASETCPPLPKPGSPKATVAPPAAAPAPAPAPPAAGAPVVAPAAGSVPVGTGRPASRPAAAADRSRACPGSVVSRTSPAPGSGSPCLNIPSAGDAPSPAGRSPAGGRSRWSPGNGSRGPHPRAGCAGHVRR